MHRPPARGLRAFTLIELIVVILILGILAAVAVVGYSQVTERAKESAAKTNLRQMATAALAAHTVDGAPELTRVGFLASMDDSSVQLVDGLQAGQTWTLFGADTAPALMDEYAVGFDYGEDSDSANDFGGTRAALVTTAGTGQEWAQIVTLGGASTTPFEVPAGSTPHDVLDGSGPSGGGGPGNGDPGDGDPDPGAGEGNGDVDPGVANPDTLATLSAWPASVDVLANDDSVGTLKTVSTPAHGQARIANGAVVYTSTDAYTGTDTFTYTTTSGATATVQVQVDPLYEACQDGQALCLNEGPNGPLPVGNPGPLDPTEAPIVAMASFPHTNPNPPHYLYLLTDQGGIFWVKDTGPRTEGGCAGDGSGEWVYGPPWKWISGPTGDPTCQTGWLYGADTFTAPTAMITGQGPGHGTAAQFTYDTLFVADQDGLWTSSVEAFTSGNGPTKLVDASKFSGQITALDGYQCFSGNTKVAGNCLWFTTSNGQVGQINVETGAVTAVASLIADGTLGEYAAGLSTVAVVTEEGQPRIVVVSRYDGQIIRLTPAGTVVSVSAGSNSGGLGASMIADDGSFAIFGTNGAGTYWRPTTPTGSWDAWQDMNQLTPEGGYGILGTHQVPGTIYFTQYANYLDGRMYFLRTNPADGGQSQYRLF